MILRVCDLQIGDVFVWLNYTYRVKKITESKVVCCSPNSNQGNSTELGAKSMMKVEVIERSLKSRINDYRQDEGDNVGRIDCFEQVEFDS